MSTGVWLYDRDDDESRRGAAIVAMDRLEKPQLDVEVLATRGDHLTVQVVRGALEDPTAILYVEQRGEFELVRLERWPADSGPPRVLLTLPRLAPAQSVTRRSRGSRLPSRGGDNVAATEVALMLRRVVALVAAATLAACASHAKSPVAAGPQRIPAAPACNGDRPLRVHFYDVGQAASALVELPDDRTVLVDAGGYKTALVPKLEPDLRGRPLSMVWITHPHDDHLNQLKAVLRHITVESYVDSGFEGGSPSRRSAAGMGSRMREAAAEAGAVVRSATVPSFAVPIPATESVSLAPIAPSAWSPSCGYGEVNNCSLGLRIDYCDSSVLFLGDAKAEEEEALELEPATLLVVAHHGSRTSTTPSLLEQVKPRYAVISAGRNSRYCHPDAGVVARLNEVLGEPYRGTVIVSAEGRGCGWFEAPRSARLWVTALDGDVTLVTNGDGKFNRE